jgi:hypothetical protein
MDMTLTLEQQIIDILRDDGCTFTTATAAMIAGLVDIHVQALCNSQTPLVAVNPSSEPFVMDTYAAAAIRQGIADGSITIDPLHYADKKDAQS